MHIFNYLDDWCGAALQWPPRLVTSSSLRRLRSLHNLTWNRRYSYMELAPRLRLMTNDTALVIFSSMSSRAQQLINLIKSQHREREEARWALTRWYCGNYQKFLKPSPLLLCFSSSDFLRCGAQHAINHFKCHPSTCLNERFVIAGGVAALAEGRLWCCHTVESWAPLRLSEFVVCEMRYMHLSSCCWNFNLAKCQRNLFKWNANKWNELCK